ncbi:MAG: TIGR02646 family protein [Lentisphaeria bacterium]|nr:TIGR02646 family protein [Lentisphaeria bacterium]
MRRIAKTAPPLMYRDWLGLANPNWTPTYAGLQNPEKAAIKSSLMDEQHFLCCYCCCRIDASSSHIEHLVPQSSRRGQLDYNNFLASCPGEDDDAQNMTMGLHCGHHKGDRELPVKPLDAGCEQRFSYDYNGAIRGTDADADTSISVLGLDVDLLRQHRRSAMEGLLGTEFDDLDEPTLRILLQALPVVDANGQLPEYLPALQFVIMSLVP